MKHRIGFAAMLLACALSFSAFGCSTVRQDDPPAPPHTHTFSEEWTYDDTYHWHEAICGHTAVSERAGHTMSEGRCSVCGYQEPHIHTDSAWQHDENSHWKVCPVCKKRYDENAHSFVGDACSVCGERKQEESHLAFILDEDTNTYILAGRGEETSSEIVVPGTYLGKAVTKVKEKAFYPENVPDATLTRIVLPQSVKEIGYNAFTHCTALTEVDFGGTESVGSSAFWDTGVVSVDLGAVKTLDDYAFYACPSLEEVKGEDLQTVGKMAFYSCKSLGKITLGAGLRSAGDDAFDKLADAVTITFAGALSDWLALDDAVFATSYLMTETRELYFGTERLTGTLRIPSGTRRVPTEAFYGVHALDSIVIPQGVETFGTDCFYNCGRSATLGVIFEGTLAQYIEEASACTHGAADEIRLTVGGTLISGQFTIPEGIKEIPAEAFYGLGNVTSLSLPKSLESIGDYAFSDCAIETCVFAGTNKEWDKIVDAHVFVGTGKGSNAGFYKLTLTCSDTSGSYPARTINSLRSSRTSHRYPYRHL